MKNSQVKWSEINPTDVYSSHAKTNSANPTTTNCPPSFLHPHPTHLANHHPTKRILTRCDISLVTYVPCSIYHVVVTSFSLSSILNISPWLGRLGRPLLLSTLNKIVLYCIVYVWKTDWVSVTIIATVVFRPSRFFYYRGSRWNWNSDKAIWKRRPNRKN